MTSTTPDPAADGGDTADDAAAERRSRREAAEPPTETGPVALKEIRDEQPRAPRSSALGRRWMVRQTIGQVPFVAASPAQAAQDLVAAALERTSGEHVHLANAYSVALADQFPALAAETFCAGDGWNLPDGRPIAVLSRARGDRPALQQVRGPQFFLDVCEAGVAPGVRHYLLGAAPDVLDGLEQALRSRFPGISIVGSDSPPYREATADELVARDDAIRRSGAHVVWVGLGTPKQDVEVVRIAHALPVVAVAIGAAFDYAAGSVREAPVWMRRAGLEWAFRFAVEPRRLWRRYVFGNARFLRVALRRPRY